MNVAVFYREYYGKTPPLVCDKYRLESIVMETAGHRAVYALPDGPLFEPVVAWGLMTMVGARSALDDCEQVVKPLVVDDFGDLDVASAVSNFLGVANAGETADDWMQKCREHTGQESES